VSAGPAAVPDLTDGLLGHDWHAAFRSMASPVSVTIGPGADDPKAAYRQIVEVFGAVCAQCTRFDAESDLMRANRAGENWVEVGGFCLNALRAAALAHLATQGRFDPRVLRALLRLGYVRSRESGRSGGPITARHAAAPSEVWHPDIDTDAGRVRIGPDPVDLGGIAKGLALRWAAERVHASCPSLLIDAGGDLVARGTSPDGGPWRIGVEDPRGGDDPVAVLAVIDRACATSSIRRGRWLYQGETVHHLVDPRTERPGGAGLLAVTVDGSDPADAEVWSKTLFLAGADGIAGLAEQRNLAALWLREDGTLGVSTAVTGHLIWSAAG
jgi:thiamine biosynthesis lipoprotein